MKFIGKVSLIFVILTVVCFEVNCQNVKRSVTAASGSTLSGGSFNVCSTVAQPPGVGTISSGDFFIRQGFQQPKSLRCLAASFQVFENADICGTSYDIEYTGDMGGGTEFLWDFGPDGSPQTSTDMNPMGVTFFNIGIQQIILTVTDDDCTEQVTKFIDVSGTGFGTRSMLTQVSCFDGNDGAVELDVFGGAPPFTYLWSTGSMQDNLQGISWGTYHVTITDMNECTTTATYKLFNPDSMALTAVVIDEECEGISDGAILVEVEGGSGIYTYDWSNGFVTQNLNGLVAGDYSLFVSDDKGCSIDTSFSIKKICDDDIVDFNTITPNGDGQNDVWTIPDLDRFPNNEVEIFNRWGGMVFYAKPYENNWSGTNSSGDELSSAGYYYIVRLNDANNTIYSGAVTIVR
jgi:gliding motility-associated-like protein